MKPFNLMKRPPMQIIVAKAFFCFLTLAAIGAENDAMPMRKIVRAEDGLKLVCEVRGKGDIALVFVHGWCGDREFWRNQADVFAPDYRVITYDQAGHSESGKERKEWTIKGLARDVESVVKALNLKRVIVVGHSMGGQIALMAAKRMPDTVIAVVGVDTLQNVEFKMPEEARKEFLDAFSADFAKTMRETFPGVVHEKTDPELKEWLLKKFQTQDQTMAVAIMRDLTTLDSTELLKEANKPVRCINSGGPFQFHTPTAIDINRKYGDYDAVI